MRLVRGLPGRTWPRCRVGRGLEWLVAGTVWLMGIVAFSVAARRGDGKFRFPFVLRLLCGGEANLTVRHFSGEESFDTGPMAPPSELPTSSQEAEWPGTKL